MVSLPTVPHRGQVGSDGSNSYQIVFKKMPIMSIEMDISRSSDNH
jgi:hypothetical protein